MFCFVCSSNFAYRNELDDWRVRRAGLGAQRMTDLGTVVEGSRKRLREVDRGHSLHLPTSSCSNLRRNKICDREGVISAEE